MEQRFQFDEIATLYEAARPGYPDALIEDVVSHADLKLNDRILEVGCGTGQATKSFAGQGFPILAIEPGPELLRVARRSLAGFSNVAFLETTFEAYPARAAFRLIVAAQSWHWVSPETRFHKAAKALSPRGSLAVFGHVPVGLPAALLARFKDIYLRRTGRWGRPPEAWYLPDGPFKGWFDESGLFGPVEHRNYPWQWRHTTASYLDFLRTRSDLRMLEPGKRDEMLSEIAAAVEDHGGAFAVDTETHLYMARRLDEAAVSAGLA
ncbi:MAG TPA: class I SAM-dependent methyltransferase [Roseiarcus sp.]